MSTYREMVESTVPTRFQVEEGCGGGVFAIRDGDQVVAVVPASDPADPSSVAKAREVAERIAISPQLEEIARQLRLGPVGEEGLPGFLTRIRALAEPVTTAAVGSA